MWNYKTLDAWHRARGLVKDVYAVSSGWPAEERFGLTSQVRRAAVSVGANLAEGCGRATPRSYAQFVSHAIGSLNEVDHHLGVADDLGFMDKTNTTRLSCEVEEIGKMLHALRKTILRAPGRA